MTCNELVLHIGMDKTGTTAIQSLLNENRSLLLKRHRLLYPRTGQWEDHSHHPFAFSIFGQHGFDLSQLQGLFRSLKKESARAGRVLLSSECLFKAPTREEFATFLEMVKDQFGHVRVIAYVRPQEDWVESRYKHAILSGAGIDLEALKKPFFCDYLRYLDHWSDIVGVGNVTVRPFERVQFVGGNIYADFLALLGVPMEEDIRLPTAALNASLGLGCVEFKALCNDIGFHGAEERRLNELLIEHTRRKRQTGHRDRLLSPTARRMLRESYASVNNDIAAKYLDADRTDLFVGQDSGSPNEWVPYSGLGQEGLREMRDFLMEHSPKVVAKLELLIRGAQESDEGSRTKAAAALGPVFLPQHS